MKDTWKKFDATLYLPALMDYFGGTVMRSTKQFISYTLAKQCYIVISTELGYRFYRTNAPKSKGTPFDLVVERLSRTDTDKKMGLWSKVAKFYAELEKNMESLSAKETESPLEIVDIGFNHFEAMATEISLRPCRIDGDGSGIFEGQVFEDLEGRTYFPYRNLSNSLTGFCTITEGKLTKIRESDISASIWFSKVPNTIKHIIVLRDPSEALAFHRRFQLRDVVYLAVSDINTETSKIPVQILKRTKLKKMVLSLTGSSKIEGYIHDLMLISHINETRFSFRVERDHLAVRFDPEGQKPLTLFHNEIMEYNQSLATDYLKHNKIMDRSLLDRNSIILTKEHPWIFCRIPFEVNALRYFLWSYYRNYMERTIEIVKPEHANWTLEFERNGAYGGTEKLKAFRMAV